MRSADRHGAGAQHQGGLPRRPPRPGGQAEGLLPQLGRESQRGVQGQGLGLGVTASLLLPPQRPVVLDPDQQVAALRAQGEHLVDVALAVSDHRQPGRAAGGGKCGRPLRRLQPAVALLASEGAAVALLPLTTGAAQQHRVQQAKQGAVRSVQRDHRVQMQAALVAIVAQAGGVLDRQDMPPRHQAPRHQAHGAGSSGRHHLRRCHPRVVQQPVQPNLAGTAAAQGPHPRPAARANLQQPRQQEGPPFSSRRSPNRPSVRSITASTPYQDHGVRARRPTQHPSHHEMCACRRS